MEKNSILANLLASQHGLGRCRSFNLGVSDDICDSRGRRATSYDECLQHGESNEPPNRCGLAAHSRRVIAVV